MNAPINLQDVLAAAAVANRCPTWAEYEAAAPCDKRAIVARWKAIMDGPLTENFTVAMARYQKAWAAEHPVNHAVNAPSWGERYHDKEFCGPRQNYEWGE